MQEDTYLGQKNDPLSLNLYTYCHNSPLMYWDPTGHSAEYAINYNGQQLSSNSANDNMAQREIRKALNKNIGTPNNPADLARINAGISDPLKKAPTVVYKTVKVEEGVKDTPSDEYLQYEQEINARKDSGENVQKQEWIQPSGWEIPYEPDKWNDYDTSGKSGIQYCTNCYGYAMNFYRNPVTGEYHTIYKETQPGYLFIKDKLEEIRKLPQDQIKNMLIIKYSDKDIAKQQIVNLVEEDVEIAGISFKPIEKHEQCEEGGYKVALVISDSDYHWYRQNPDGTWSHKPGSLQVYNSDDPENPDSIIYDPEFCNRGEYTYFAGFYEVVP